MPYLRPDTSIDLQDLAALTAIFETAYGNPTKVADTEYKLKHIQQRNREFSLYYAEFQRYSVDVEWNEAAKLAALKMGISYQLQQDLVSIETEPTTVETFVTVCNRLDTRCRACALRNQRPTHSHKLSTGPMPPPRTTSNSATSAAPSTATSSTTATGTQARPIDLSANQKRITPEERAKGMAEGRCRYCGGMGHFAANCPLAPRRLTASETTTVQTSAPPAVKPLQRLH